MIAVTRGLRLLGWKIGWHRIQRGWPLYDQGEELCISWQYIWNDVCTRVANCLWAHEVIWCLFPELCSSEGNKHQNNTRVVAQTVRHESTYIIAFLIWHNESINDDETTIFTRRPRISVTRFTFFWWRHNRSLMMSQCSNNCDANMWKAISHPLNINSTQGDIQGRSSKNIEIVVIILIFQHFQK